MGRREVLTILEFNGGIQLVRTWLTCVPWLKQDRLANKIGVMDAMLGTIPKYIGCLVRKLGSFTGALVRKSREPSYGMIK